MRKAVILVFLGWCAGLGGASFQGTLNTNAYTYSRINLEDSSLTHLRLSESFWLQARDLVFRNSSLRLSGVMYLDPVQAYASDPTLSLINAAYSVSLGNRALTLNLGRQFVYLASDAGRLDGLHVQWRKKHLRFTGFIGGYVPATGWTGDPVTSSYWGTQLGWRTSSSAIKLAWSQKSLARSYRSLEVPARMRNLLGIQAGHRQGKWSGYLRTRVQATRFTLYDALLRAEYRNPTSHRLRVSAEFQTRTPRIAENSIFSVFEAYNSQELRVRLERQIQGDLNGRIALRQVWFHQESATILTLGASRQHTALAWIWQDGYGGTSNRVQLTTQGTWKGLFLAGRASLGNYRLLEGTLEDLATYSVTAEYPLSKRLVFRGDVQWLRNRYYARDVRFLAGLRVRI